MYICYLIEDDENGKEHGYPFGAAPTESEALSIAFKHTAEFYGGNLRHCGDLQIQELDITEDEAESLNSFVDKWLRSLSKLPLEEV